jgi:glycosyltransferase involved in cell wall biosynthesis
MNAAFVVCGRLDRVSGGFLYDRMLIAAMRAAGARVDVVELPWQRYGWALATNVLPLPAALTGYDVIIQDELAHPALFARNNQLRLARVPIIALVHNLASSQPRARLRPVAALIERTYLRSVDAVVAVCESTRREVEALTARPARALVAYAGRDHVSPGVDAAAVAARAVEPGPLRVLSVAAVAPHKGLLRLLDAIAAVADTALDVAGSLAQAPAYVRTVQARIGTLGLGSRVRLHGELGGEALAALYRRSHVMALPSDREAYPLAGLEALGFGLPALLPAAGGANELVRDGIEGRVLDAGDVPAWSAALARFAVERETLTAAGRAALVRWRAHGTWADTAARVTAFCAEVARPA